MLLYDTKIDELINKMDEYTIMRADDIYMKHINILTEWGIYK